MIDRQDYEGRQRECLNCGHFTSVHMYCSLCEQSLCEACEDTHVCEEQAIQLAAIRLALRMKDRRKH